MVEEGANSPPTLPRVMSWVFVNPPPCKMLHVTSSLLDLSISNPDLFWDSRNSGAPDRSLFSSCECERSVKVGSSCEGRDNSSSPRRPSTSWTSTYIFSAHPNIPCKGYRKLSKNSEFLNVKRWWSLKWPFYTDPYLRAIRPHNSIKPIISEQMVIPKRLWAGKGSCN